ncbi:uncharacterized protein LOC108087048 [Drosophila ficusphila]|uniref:uncharacterized protein LOC108087048 n=1 Tax=Drosophila ficusphila TaxID=30025 RepID=UPI0007E7676C|nr:uncharacterized protein LOC108087048 [Drosophila ficusphila]
MMSHTRCLRWRNFYFVNNLAYTEDRAVVRRLKVLAFTSLSTRDVWDHFSRDGTMKVEEVQWDERMLVGSVLFKDATDASKTLCSWSLSHNDYKLYLWASNTWEQPEEEDAPGSVSAYDLPLVDDIWRKVIDYLPLKDCLAFSASCRKFHAIYEQAWKQKSRVLDMWEVGKLTKLGLRRLMRLSGEHIHRLEDGPPKDWPYLKYFVKWLRFSCPNLRELSLSDPRLTASRIHLLLYNSSQHITDLTLCECNLRDKYLINLKYLSTLKNLDVQQNQGLRGLFLRYLPFSLEKLNVSDCQNLKAQRFSTIKRLPLLRELRCQRICTTNFNREWMDMRDRVRLLTNSFVYQHLVERCPAIEVLEVTVCPYLDEPQIGRFPHLHTLLLGPLELESSPYQVNNLLLSALVEVASLRHLQLPMAGKGFLSTSGLEIICRMKQLRTLILCHQDFAANKLKGLRSLGALEFLDLTGSRNLSNQITVQLTNSLSRLRRLNVRWCPLITGELFDILKVEKPMLQVVDYLL